MSWKWIDGARYTDGRGSYVLLGVKRRTVVMRDLASGETLEVEREIADRRFVDTGIHDHEHFCCTVHNTHSMPHMGCLFR